MIRGTHMVRDPALTVVEREMVRKYLFNTIWPTCDEAVPRPAYGLRFSEGQFMYTEGHPLLDAAYPRTTNLVQRVDERRPTLTYWPALVKSID